MADKVENKKVDPKKVVEKKSENKKTDGKKVEEKSTKVVVKKVKKAKRIVEKAKVHIISTFNNSKITITDLDGNVLSWSSCGTVGFKGTKKSTAYAATKAAEDALAKAQKYGIKEASVYVKGIGQGRQAAVKGLKAAGLQITMLSDMTPVPHGGVKPKKPRKV
ncbi:MAG: 30S ribosomal protein S11 [bacterium]